MPVVNQNTAILKIKTLIQQMIQEHGKAFVTVTQVCKDVEEETFGDVLHFEKNDEDFHYPDELLIKSVGRPSFSHLMDQDDNSSISDLIYDGNGE